MNDHSSIPDGASYGVVLVAFIAWVGCIAAGITGAVYTVKLIGRLTLLAAKQIF